MARFNINEAKNYGGNSSFFSLKEDKATANVRFLLNDINDLYGVTVHEVDENGNKYDVECLRAYNEPIDNCPLCAAGYKLDTKLFIPLYNEDEQRSQVWTRGKAYFDKIAGFCSRYNPLVSTPFEIERHGKKGDTNTSYEMYPGRPDKSTLQDFPEIKIEGTAFQVKTFEEMNNFLDTGTFDANHKQPVRAVNSARQVPIRRTPTRTNEEDNF